MLQFLSVVYHTLEEDYTCLQEVFDQIHFDFEKKKLNIPIEVDSC